MKVVRATEPPDPPRDAPNAREAPAVPLVADTRPPARAPAEPRRLGRVLLAFVLVVAVAAAAQWGHRWWTIGRFVVSTDDAYVRAEVSTIATKIAGYVAAIAVRNGDVVRFGGVFVNNTRVELRQFY